MTLSIVVLAAGLGKRMCSTLPKVLHPLGGKPLLTHVITAAQALQPAGIYVIYGHQGERVRTQLADLNVQWIEQTQQLGTGHAALQAMPYLKGEQRILILFGDGPLISPQTLQKLLHNTPENNLGLLTVNLPDPTGLGRMLRDAAGKVLAVVEEKDATLEQKKISEVNGGIMLAPLGCLRRWLDALNNNNAQGEYYLPDIIAMAVKENMAITTMMPDAIAEVQGVNDRAQLAALERIYQQQQAEKLMLAGVTLRDPNRFDLRGDAQIAADVTIDINVILEGTVTIGAGSYIGPNCLLTNVEIGTNVQIKANSVIENAIIAENCVIGPFARIRPETVLAAGVHVGNFVEIKKSKVAQGSKINHLSYVGDATVGAGVNIGAGTITCNYDGVNKYQTIIGDDVFIGSNSQLIAPVTIGEGATIGAGSTIVRNAPAGTLTLSRAEQKTVAGWRRKKKS